MKGHPVVYRSGDLPIDDIRFDADECSKYFGFIKATVEAPDNLFFPILWHRANGKLYFTMCRMC